MMGKFTHGLGNALALSSGDWNFKSHVFPLDIYIWLFYPLEKQKRNKVNSKLSLFNGLPLTNTEWKSELPQVSIE